MWEYENFASDTARDALGFVIRKIVEDIRDVFTRDSESNIYGQGGDEQIAAYVDILGTLCDHYRYHPDLTISIDEIQQWKDKLISTYDRILPPVIAKDDPYTDLDDLEYTKKRREVIVQTFDRFIAIIQKLAQDP
jgi:hypothetical protein